MPRTLSTVSSLTKSNAKSGLRQYQQEHLDTSRPTGEEVTSINIVSKGFFCLVGGKRLCLFSKIAESWDFAKTREYVVPTSEINTARSSNTNYSSSENSSNKHQLNSGQLMGKVAVSPKEEHVLVLTNKQQIYSVSDITKDQSAESRVNNFFVLFLFYFSLLFQRNLFYWN